MACNGYNHSPDCDCLFRGGDKTSHPARPIPDAPLFGPLAPPELSRPRKTRRIQLCRKCRQQVIYTRCENGGHFMAAARGPLIKHNCPKSLPDRPLKLGKASWRKDWLPATLRAANDTDDKQIITIETLLDGDPFKVRLDYGITIDTTQPAVCRASPDNDNIIEISYIDNDTKEVSSTRISAVKIDG